MSRDYLSQLPIELYLHTLSFLRRSDLASLICVSRIYRNATERELYRKIELTGSTLETFKCLRSLSCGSNSPGGLVQTFSLRFPEDEYKDEDRLQMEDRFFWLYLSLSLQYIVNAQEIQLECPYHPEVWASLLSTPKPHLRSLALVHLDDYNQLPKTDVYEGQPPFFNPSAYFPSLIYLEIQVGFHIDATHQDFIHSLLSNHAPQLRAISIDHPNVPRKTEKRSLPHCARFPNIEILADLRTSFLEPLISVQLPNLKTLTFAPMSPPTCKVTGEELAGHFKNLHAIEASYSVLQLFLASPRSLEHIEMQPTIGTQWEDVRTAVKLLVNSSGSLRVLHLDLFLPGAKLKELWSLIPPLPHLEILLLRVAPDWCNFDLREAVSYAYGTSPEHCLIMLSLARYHPLGL